MKQLLGFILIGAGCVVGVYVGLWVCLVGGIADIVNGYNIGNTGLAMFGLMKFVFAGIVGWLSAGILVAPGVILIGDE